MAERARAWQPAAGWPPRQICADTGSDLVGQTTIESKIQPPALGLGGFVMPITLMGACIAVLNGRVIVFFFFFFFCFFPKIN